MGQVVQPTAQSLILSAVDRLVAANADGGLSPLASHVILLGEDAGENLGDVDNVIVLGAFSLNGGTSAPSLQGSNIIGSQILSDLTNATAPVQRTGPVTVIGFNDFPNVSERQGAYVAIGAQIGATMPAGAHELSASVMIGNDVLGRQRTLASNGGVGNVFNVIIGDRAARGGAFTVDGAGVMVQSSVIVGAEACELIGFDGGIPGTTFSGNVAIGRRALRSACINQNNTVQANVAIGNQAAQDLQAGQDNVFIGSGLTTALLGMVGNTLIGSNIGGGVGVNATGNVAIGTAVELSTLLNNNILIGRGCNGTGVGALGAVSNRLLIETGEGGTKRTILFGIVDAGSAAVNSGLVVGNSTGGVNRDLPGFNILKLVNGGRDTGITAPVGGGFLYGDAGALHWVDTNGDDTLIAGPGGETSPAALAAGNTNDWNGTQNTSRIVNVTADAAGSTLTGLLGGFGGRQVTFFVSGGQLDLADDDAGSTAANRILTPGGVGAIVQDGGSVTFLYSATAQRWRVIALT